MRKEIVNFILLVLLISGSIISFIMISQYQDEVARLNDVVDSVKLQFDNAQNLIQSLSDQETEVTSLPFQDVQIPITGNPTFSSMEARLAESQLQIEALEAMLGLRKMCVNVIKELDMSNLEVVNSTIENYVNEFDNPDTKDGYWVTIWDYDYDITEHGFYGDGGLFWYFLAYRDSYDPGIYSVEDACWIYSE